MKIRTLILTAALAGVGLTACGGEDTSALDAGAAFALSSGTFTVSNVQSVERDECQMMPAFQAAGAVITVTNEGGAVSFNLDNAASPNSETLSTATLSGNELASPVRALYTLDTLPDGCQLLVDRTVTGHLSADDTLALRLDVVIADASDVPGTCTAEDAHADRMPCDSSFTFTATRAQ